MNKCAFNYNLKVKKLVTIFCGTISDLISYSLKEI